MTRSIETKEDESRWRRRISRRRRDENGETTEMNKHTKSAMEN